MDAANPLVGAIDQGTSSSRFLVFDPRDESVVAQFQVEVKSRYPREGWVEQDPYDILDSVKTCISQVYNDLKQRDLATRLTAIGITNQRETTLVWDRSTGKPLHNAIVWLDARTQATVEKLIRISGGEKGTEVLKDRCGLPLSTYFSAVKLRWLLDNVEEVAEAARDKRLCFGTVDSWLLWNLTGGTSTGKLHITDVTNASRTMLMNLKTLSWDQQLIDFFGLDAACLPKIVSSSQKYGCLDYPGSPWPNVPVSGCLGDQQAALVGQHCLRKGMAKNTYGTGCFLLYNVGQEIVISTHGMLSTVAYQFGNEAAVYALEGSIAVAGAAVAWLRDNLGIIQKSDEIETLAAKVEDTGGVYFVPAFSGLFAPHWRPDARAVICGMSQFTRKEHLCLATLEAVCFQTREIVDAMNDDSGLKLDKLLVDGGMTKNELLMQMQADFLNIMTVRPFNVETTALGAAMAAGRALGVWSFDSDSGEVIRQHRQHTFRPKMTSDLRQQKYETWKKAIKRSLDWEETDDTA